MPSRHQVFVTDALAEIGAERKILDDVADVTLLQTNDEEDVARRASAAAVLLVYHTIKLTERTIAKLHKCRGITRCGVGYVHVDIADARANGIVPPIRLARRDDDGWQHRRRRSRGDGDRRNDASAPNMMQHSRQHRIRLLVAGSQ